MVSISFNNVRETREAAYRRAKERGDEKGAEALLVAIHADRAREEAESSCRKPRESR